MSTIQIFILVNVIGGVSVLGSYLLGLTRYPELRMNLWGGVAGKWRTTFSISMVIAAIGYLSFLHYVVFQSGLIGFETGSTLLRISPIILCAVFLIAASIWMPATLVYLDGGRAAWWNIGVVSLWVVAICLLLLTVSFVVYHPEEQALSRIIGLVGLVYITIHCVVLDAIIWVKRFPVLTPTDI